MFPRSEVILDRAPWKIRADRCEIWVGFHIFQISHSHSSAADTPEARPIDGWCIPAPRWTDFSLLAHASTYKAFDGL